MVLRHGFGCCLLVLAGAMTVWAADEAAPTSPKSDVVRQLSEFGSLKSADEIKAAYAKAKREMTTGGVLLVPPGVAALYSEENTTQVSTRKLTAEGEVQAWKTAGPGITVVEVDPEGTTVQAPSVSGLTLQRVLRMPVNESLPHWTTDFALNINNKLVHGSQSYLDWTNEPIVAGKDTPVYVNTIRGLRVGAFMNIVGPKLSRVLIKSLGYDTTKNKWYFTADIANNFPTKTIVQNKSNEGLIFMTQECNADNQTYDIMLNRYQYALGDTYLFFGRYRYMSNIHSAGGDENGNVFACYTENITRGFTATVESVDWKEQSLKFAKALYAETLGNSRAIINLNPSKAITSGKVIIVPAESYTDTLDTGKYPFGGKTYPSSVVPGVGLRMGGLIRGDKDCPWDEKIIGRWFGVTEPTELIHGDDVGNKPPTKVRWYQIDGLTINPDGTKDITIQRFWWGAKTMQSPTLYREDNYTWDGHEKPLSYSIVPGTYATDVARAVPSAVNSKNVKVENVIGLAPSTDMGTRHDFEKGDPIEQAIGPDPFKPTPLRLWMQDGIPSAYPAPGIDLINSASVNGHVTQRHAGIRIRGGPDKIEDTKRTADGKPAYDNGVTMDCAMNVGLNLIGDFANAGILFQQPNHEQPIKWYYGKRENGKPFTAATLVVAKETGDLTFKGGDTRFSGSVMTKGLSGDDKPAKNLRGKNVPVNAGATSIDIVLPTAEADADYAVFIEQTWFGNRAITTQTEKGFTVSFEKPVPANAKINWLIVR